MELADQVSARVSWAKFASVMAIVYVYVCHGVCVTVCVYVSRARCMCVCVCGVCT